MCCRALLAATPVTGVSADDPSDHVELPPTPSAARAARAFLAEHAAGLDGDAAETALLCASELVTNGGRVLVLSAHGHDLEDATARAYEACARVTFEGAYFRTDIAQRPAPVLTTEVVN